MDRKFDYLIIGGGVSGLTLCKKLREKGKRVIVLEAKDVPGGLCTTKNINGHQLDVGGGHFFFAKHQAIFDYIFGLLPKEEFNYFDPRISKLKIGETTIDYPLESNLWQLPQEEQIEFLISVIRNGESLGKPEPKNYEEWLRWKLGDKICDEYMIPYNEKLWGVSPSEMDVDWLYKIPRVNVDEVLRYCLNKKQDVNKYPAHICFYYPKEGGFQRIVDAIYRDEKDFVALDERVVALERRADGTWIVNGKYQAANVVNTSPWNDLYPALGSPAALKNAFAHIKYNRILVSLYEKEYTENWHWRYVPDRNRRYHREFYIGNFAKDSRSNGIYLETNVKRFQGEEKLFNGEMIYSEATDAAYPIPVLGHRKAITDILDYYRPLKLFGVGRWGQHQYQNADVSMFEAFKFVESVC
jgi:protoporphyrinogen oxidase